MNDKDKRILEEALNCIDKLDAERREKIRKDFYNMPKNEFYKLPDGLKLVGSGEMNGRIEEIRARCEAATAAPWEADYNVPFTTDFVGIMTMNGYIVEANNFDSDEENTREEDAEFIAHAREDIPYLLELLTERDAEIKRLRIAAGEVEK